jgi:integrase
MYAIVKIYRNNAVIDFIKDRQYLRYPTGITKVEPEQLSGNKLTEDVPDFKAKNKKIELLLAKVERIIDDYFVIYKETPSVLYIKEKLNGATIVKDKEGNTVEITKEKTLTEIYEEFIKYKNGEPLQKSSLKDYTSTKNALYAYKKVKGGLTVDYVNSIEFIKKFEKFCSEPMNPKPKDKRDFQGEMNDNTIKKRVAVIKTFIKWCCEPKQSYVTKNEIIHYRSGIKAFQPTVIILTKEEQKKLEEADLTGQTEILRDIMLFLCKTGMRYSDLLTLTADDEVNGYITKNAEKTRNRFKVQLTTKAKLIGEKYCYNFNIFSTTMFNRLIKKLLEKLEICDYLINIRNISYKAITTTQVKKYEKICSHTGRRSFVAHCVESNKYSLFEIMEMTGHKSVSMLQKYVDIFGHKPDSEGKINFLD